MQDTVLVPVIHENSLNSSAELKHPDTFRRVFVSHLPNKHCFFIKAGFSGDMKPVIQPGGLALIQPMHLTLPVKHQLVDKEHPKLLRHRDLVAIIYNGQLLLRCAYSSVDARHRPLNVYIFEHYPQRLNQNTHIIIPNLDHNVQVIGRIVEVINQY